MWCASLPPGSYASAQASDNGFQLKRWRRPGVCPRGAHVARTDGSNDTPDSLSNTIGAFWHRAVFQLRPALLDPLLDGFVVSFHRTPSLNSLLNRRLVLRG